MSNKKKLDEKELVTPEVKKQKVEAAPAKEEKAPVAKTKKKPAKTPAKNKIETKTSTKKKEKVKAKEPKAEKPMGEKLKQLLDKTIKETKKRSKTRLAEMIGIFSAHNFYSNGLTPHELRTTLEDLGPTYVKIGQIMSSRPDLLPESYCKELEKLRQNVKPLDPEIAKAVIEDEIGKPINEIYSEFRDKPLGSASIGQAHYAVLKDGTKVVTKVQRPLIGDMMRKDFVLLKKLAKLVNVVSSKDSEDQVIDLVSVINELEKVTEEELDFRVEASNTKFFKENCIEDENVITCPTVIDELTTSKIFTMTYVDGCSLGHKDELIAQGCNLNEIGTAIVNNFVHQILDVGTFHADPHQGNIMVSNKKPYWIDFGMVGRISKKEIDLIQSMVLSVITSDTDQLITVIMSMGATSPKTNPNKLATDVEIFLSKTSGSESLADMDMSAMLSEVMDLAARHHIKLPGSYTLLARAVLAIEGVIEQLCPELNLLKLISDKLMTRIKNNIDFRETLLGAGKGALATSKKAIQIPNLAADSLSNLNKGRLKINTELTGMEEPLAAGRGIVKNVVLAFMSCILFLSGSILAGVNIEPKTTNGMPYISIIILTFATALGIYSVIRLLKKK